MKTSYLSLLTAFAVAGSTASATLITFDAPADLGEFVQLRAPNVSNAGLAVEQSASAGTGPGPSGGLIKTDVGTGNGNNDLALVYTPGGVYADAATAFDVGQTISLSIKFKTSSGSDANLAATPRLGIAGWSTYDSTTVGGTDFNSEQANRFVFGGNNNSNGNNPTDSIMVSPSGDNGVVKDLQIYGTVENSSANRQLFANAVDDALMISDSWYEMELEVTKSAVADTFDVVAALNLLNSDGTAVDSVAQTNSASMVLPALYAESSIVSGFSWSHNGGPAAMVAEMDDFEVSVIPEPGSLLLAGVAAAFGLRRRV